MEETESRDRILSLETDIRQLNLLIMQNEQRTKSILSELVQVQSERDSLKLTHPEDVENLPSLSKRVQPLIQQYVLEIAELKSQVKQQSSQQRAISRMSASQSSNSLKSIAEMVKRNMDIIGVTVKNHLTTFKS